MSILLTAVLLACDAGNEDSNMEESVLQLEAKVQSLEESLEALSDENAAQKDEIAVLQESLKDRDTRIAELEEVTAKLEFDWPDKEEWSNGKDEKSSMPEGTAVERTARLAKESGGLVHYVNHPGRGDLTVLVTPQEFTDGETPLIVSLHGFGGDSADHSAYVPLHERVNTDGFALLLPNGILNAEGSRFWNPTDECCEGGKSGEDDVAYLTELVAEAQRIMDFGPVYFFGYSNGGFMAHHMACKGLPGLRAVASLAGTSYVEDAACDGSSAVSVLHIHGTDDGVILFDGDDSEPDPKGRRRYGVLPGSPGHGGPLESPCRLRLARQPPAIRRARPGRIRSRLRNTGISPGIGLRPGNHHRTMDGRGQRPRARVRRRVRGRPARLVTGSRVGARTSRQAMTLFYAATPETPVRCSGWPLLYVATRQSHSG